MRNDCVRHEVNLAALASGELCAAEHADLATHLADCQPCRSELARERELRAVLGQLPLQACPPRVTLAIHRRLAGTGGGPPARRPWLPLGLGLAAAAVAAILLLPAWLPGPGPSVGTRGPVAVAPVAYTDTEIAQARRDAVAALQLAASLLDRNRDRAVVDVFGHRLPRAVAGALRPAVPRSQAHDPATTTTTPGGNG